MRVARGPYTRSIQTAYIESKVHPGNTLHIRFFGLFLITTFPATAVLASHTPEHGTPALQKYVDLKLGLSQKIRNF